MSDGKGPRQPEPIHVLPEEMAELPVDGKLMHMARMMESYLHRLFTHTYAIEHTLKDDEIGLCLRMRTVESFQDQLRENDAVAQVSWVRGRRKFEGRVMAGIVIAILVEAIALVVIGVAALGGS